MLEPDDPVDFAVLTGNHNERHIANRPHLPRQLQAVSLTELQVKGHEIDHSLAEQVERLMFRGRLQNGKSLRFESVPKDAPHPGIVVHDETCPWARQLSPSGFLAGARGSRGPAAATRKSLRPATPIYRQGRDVLRDGPTGGGAHTILHNSPEAQDGPPMLDVYASLWRSGVDRDARKHCSPP